MLRVWGYLLGFQSKRMGMVKFLQHSRFFFEWAKVKVKFLQHSRFFRVDKVKVKFTHNCYCCSYENIRDNLYKLYKIEFKNYACCLA